MVPTDLFLSKYKGSTEFVSNPVIFDRGKPGISRTSINVAISVKKPTHHSLQLVVDDNVAIVGKGYYSHHNGRIGFGSGKIDELRQFIIWSIARYYKVEEIQSRDSHKR